MKQETKPQDTSTRKDELDITVMSITIQETDKLTYPFDLYDNNGKCVAVIPWGINRKLPETMVEVKRNTEKIRTAVNSTYGKGYNPAAMEELIKALTALTNMCGIIPREVFTEAGQRDFQAILNASSTALTNAKTIKP